MLYLGKARRLNARGRPAHKIAHLSFGVLISAGLVGPGHAQSNRFEFGFGGTSFISEGLLNGAYWHDEVISSKSSNKVLIAYDFKHVSGIHVNSGLYLSRRKLATAALTPMALKVVTEEDFDLGALDSDRYSLNGDYKSVTWSELGWNLQKVSFLNGAIGIEKNIFIAHVTNFSQTRTNGFLSKDGENYYLAARVIRFGERTFGPEVRSQRSSDAYGIGATLKLSGKTKFGMDWTFSSQNLFSAAWQPHVYFSDREYRLRMRGSILESGPAPALLGRYGLDSKLITLPVVHRASILYGKKYRGEFGVFSINGETRPFVRAFYPIDELGSVTLESADMNSITISSRLELIGSLRAEAGVSFGKGGRFMFEIRQVAIQF